MTPSVNPLVRFPCLNCENYPPPVTVIAGVVVADADAFEARAILKANAVETLPER